VPPLWKVYRITALSFSKRLTSAVADLGDVYPAQLLVDGVDNPVDVRLLAVEKMMERWVFGSGNATRGILSRLKTAASRPINQTAA
jgi:hypothetical protein